MITFLLVIIVVILAGPVIFPILIGLATLAATPFIFFFVLLFGDTKAKAKKVRVTVTRTKKERK